ncbi:MAG TPA: hypothetical protein VGC86_05385 [Afipia sp.]
MVDQEQRDKDRDNQIAENEAKRGVVSQARVSIWAILAAGIVALIGVWFYLTR